MSNTQVKVNLDVFPLPIVESALYVLSERIDGRIGEVEDGEVTVKLSAIEAGLDIAEMERIFNRVLITANVNERAFRRAAPIRNYLAQTAFSITTQNQQTIEEFVANVSDHWLQEHAGAPVAHLDVQPHDDERFMATEGGNHWLLDETGRIILQIDMHRFLLPDVLWVANEMIDICACSVDNMLGNRLLVVFEPRSEGIEPTTLVERFEQWLAVAKEHHP